MLFAKAQNRSSFISAKLYEHEIQIYFSSLQLGQTNAPLPLEKIAKVETTKPSSMIFLYYSFIASSFFPFSVNAN